MLSANEIKLLEEVFQTVSNVEVQIQSVFKNGIQKTGVIFNTGNILRPCAYVEDYQYMDFADLAKQMLIDIANVDYIPDPSDVKNLQNWEEAKHRLQLCVSPKTNEDIVKRDYLDLHQYVRVAVNSNEDEFASAKVTPSLLAIYGVSEDTLFAYAEENTVNRARIGDMFALMMGKELLSISDFSKKNTSEIISVTNKQGEYGAGVLACKDAIAGIAKELEQDLYILPSSIHEILLVPVETATRERLEEMSNMVREVNETQVDPEERLSNHAYAYSRDMDEIFW